MSRISNTKLGSFVPKKDNTALIVVDVQNDFCHSEGVFAKYQRVELGHVEKAVRNLAADSGSLVEIFEREQKGGREIGREDGTNETPEGRDGAHADR